MPPASPSSRPFTPRLVAAAALAWGALVWTNWFAANPLDLPRLGRALLAWAAIRPGPALAAGRGHAEAVLHVLALALAARGAGGRPAAWLAGGTAGATTALALGAGALAFATLGLGAAGLALPVVAWTLVLAAAAVGLTSLRPGDVVARWRAAWTAATAGRAAGATALVVVAAGLALVGALAPESSYDALFHHLAHPQLFAARHKIIALPHHFLSHYPALLEMLYLLAWLTGGGAPAAKLVHYGFGLLTLAVLAAWARRSLEPRWALAAVAGFALLPYVQIVMMWAYVDLGFACFFTLACERLCRRRTGSLPLLGTLCGLCMGTKAAGVFAPALAGAVLLARGARPSTGLRTSFLPFAAACGLLAAPWGVRNWSVTGNPFAPFLSSLVPTLNWGAENQARYAAELRSYQAAGGASGGPVAGVLVQGWSSTIRNLGVLDRGAGMGAWFLFALPLLLLLQVPAARLPAGLALGYFALWLCIPRQVRYLLPAWPAAALASAHAVRALARRGGAARAVAGALGAVLVLQLPLAVARQYEARDPVPVVFGRETVTSYLNRGVPGRPHSLRARDWVAARLAGRRFLVVSEYGMGMLWGPDAVIQSVFDTPLIERFAREGRDEAHIARKFRQAGADHLLYGVQGGFAMQPVYDIYHFNAGAAARWRAFWGVRAEPVHGEAERYLVYAIRRTPRESARASAYPGLDEQWLGGLDRALWDAGEKGTRGRDLPRFAAEFARVAERTDSPCAWDYTGEARLELKDWAGARVALERAARLGRETAALHAALATLDARDQDWRGAIRRYRLALARDPTLASARAALARLLFQLGETREAILALREGLQLDPADAELAELWGRFTGNPVAP